LSTILLSGAQAQPAPTSPTARGDVIETVTVTARKRAESEQKTPVAVTALGEDQLDKLFVHDLADLNHQAPNFTIEGVGAIHRNAAVIYSRGVGYSGVDMGQDPAVGVSVNGVFATRNIGMMSNMQDVDHVEILRGPQGTLFGKNTVGGVINITTKKPGDEYALEAMVRGGNYNRFDYFAAIDLPINDTLAARIAFQSQYSHGPFQNAYTGPVQPLFAPFPARPRPNWLGGDNIKTVRGTVVWNPTEAFEADLVVTFMNDRSPSVGGQNGSTPKRLAPVPGSGSLALCAAAPAIPDPDGHGCIAPDAILFFGHPGFDYRTPGLPYPAGPNDAYTVYRNFPSGDFQATFNTSLNMRYHLPGFDIVSVTGYIHDGNMSYSDYDDTELNFFQSTFALHSRQYSEELRLESTDTGPVKWQVGGLFSGRTWDGTQQFYSIFGALNTNIDFARQTDTAIAAFGQVDYSITDELTFTGGIRFTSESKNIFRIPSHPAAVPTPPLVPLPGQKPQKTWSNISYYLGANYQIDDDKMVYASFSTGFVAGGFNTRVDSSLLAFTPYAPETVEALEVGFKSDWLDHRLRINLAAFHNHYAHLQVGAFLPGGSLQQAIVNDAYETANGLEFEGTVIPVDGLTLGTSVGYLDAHYTSFTANVLGTGVHDFSSLVVARAPKWTARVEASYVFDLGDDMGTLTPNTSYAYETKHFTDLTNNPTGFQTNYGLWNASLTYDSPDSRWSVSLWGKNLGDVAHRMSAVPSSGFFTQLYFDQPRTFGVDINIKTGL
jgi:iron complex outermembrane receptor protein